MFLSLDEAMNLPLEQREMLIQILQRGANEQRRDEERKTRRFPPLVMLSC